MRKVSLIVLAVLLFASNALAQTSAPVQPPQQPQAVQSQQAPIAPPQSRQPKPITKIFYVVVVDDEGFVRLLPRQFEVVPQPREAR